jgi:Tol biopolymer transport system component
MSGRAFPRFLGAALAAGALLALPALAADDDLELVSRATGGAAADDASNFPSISVDGGRVAFISDADNLVAGDDNTLTNVFVRDVGQGSTTFVNRADGIAGAPSGQSAFLGVISGDGNQVAFDGTSTIGAPPADPPTRQILLRNVALGTTTLVSRADGPAGAPADATPFQPSISSDGRVVAFESAANNLSSEDDNAVTNIFARDAVSGTTTLVSRASGPGGAGGTGGSTSPSVSGDGRIVVFLSEANNLSTADADGNRDVFARDLVTNLTVLVSRATGPDGAGANGDSGTAAVSDDGRHVLFYSTADNLSAEDDNAVSNVYVRDLVANTTTLVSRVGGASGAGGDGDSSWGDISADGRFAVFHSLAKNLSAEDGDGTRDVFVRDLVASTTALVSRAAGPSGAAADGNSVFPVISADGRRVGFVSEADNLSADDLNTVGNIFVRTLPPPGALPGPVSPAPAQGAPVPAAAARAVVRCAGIRATIVGTARRDVIRGTARRDVIASLGGNDVVRGLGGNDLICLGAGNDTGDGGAGADRILGQAGRDLLIGGPGLDRLLGLGGRDIARGGLGRDVCAVESRTSC